MDDINDIAVKNFIKRFERINQMIREKEFDGIHCVFCGSLIEPQERVTEMKKTYCKKCAERIFR